VRKKQTTMAMLRTDKKNSIYMCACVCVCFIHSCCCQRSFQTGRRADDERLLPCNDVGADPGRDRTFVPFNECDADEGRLGFVDFLSIVE